jgi:type IV secretory pathway TraG/TraD family ATPase VirD4
MHAHKYYYRRSSDVFYGCLLYLKYKYDIKYFNLITAVSFFEKGNKFIENEIKSYNGEKNIKIKGLFNNFFELPVFERAKIITDILNGLDFLKNENVKNAFKTNFDTVNNNDLFTINDIFADDALLITSIPKEKLNSGGSKLMSFITDLIIKEIYEDRRMRLKDKNLEKRKDMYIYLDEFPVLNLNNFDTELANLRKTGTGVCISLQDISFLKNKYGNVSLIDSNIGTHIIMGQAGIDTCEHYSRKMGQKYIFHKEHLLINPANNNLEGLFNSNMSNHTYNNRGMVGEERTREVPVASGLYPLMSANEIKNIQTDNVLIYSKYTNPFILKLNDSNVA